MKYSLYFILLIVCSSQVQPNQHKHTIYHLIPGYSTYQELFKKNAGPNRTIQMTEYGTGKELCAQMKACRYYIYLYQPEDIAKVKYTVLMTAGIHGNQLLGPTTLLHLYPMLKPNDVRIIYFPVLNPSGYDRKVRETFPNQLDLNRDYPIDGNHKCYEGSATRIIDKLFRKYRIDLTVNLHNGDDQISWNWGTYYNQKFPKTDDEPIYSSIGKMLFFYGGSNQKLKIDPFKVGTMTQVIYPAIGTLDDWAYAGSWAESAVFKCEKYQFAPYPKEMHQGLMFLFQLGVHNAPENMLGTSQGLNQPSDSTKISNGYITRALRMLRELIKVVSPVIEFGWNGSKFMAKIQGCSTVESLQVSVAGNNKQADKITIQKLTKIEKTFTFIVQLAYRNEQMLKENNLTLSYKYSCNKDWFGKGKSFLGKPRVFQGQLVISQNQLQIQKIQNIAQQLTTKRTPYWIIALILLILFAMFIYRLFIRRRPGIKASTSQTMANRTNESNQLPTESIESVSKDEYVQVESQSFHTQVETQQLESQSLNA